MTSVLSQIFLSSSARKILTYYAGYSCLFLLSYLALVSTTSFFHFLLDHEMGVIEGWLSSNAWELLLFAKLIAAMLSLKSLKLNNYLLKDSWDLVKAGRFLPEQKVVVMIVFLLVFFAALIHQFQGGLKVNPDAEFLATSYVGTIGFFLIDVFVIFSALSNFPLERKRQSYLLGVALPVIFLATTKIALPYLDGTAFFLLLNFCALMGLMSGSKNNLANLIIYSLAVTGPLAALVGVDAVWGDSRSAYLYPSNTPAIGILGVWLTGFLYYLRRKRAA